ncbi:bifunctional riboflavin kinase/FAD synthetase [Halioxenophilus sp. WMMB6]|uniref:bifunctional riboflavin kinase/FAD synthetase n=1 Tax=Halioxenophilus sp. WMMB6 TaxID=3073815 RepID=UPI00295EE81D|nr:bifunctional riboflavin kinase/FAD synthetase [Halioxenophilus sp. WMMB6]
MAPQSPRELVCGLHNIKARHRGCVLTVGSFDGVHLGHQQVLRQVRERAAALGLPSAVMIFEPQPLEFLAPEKAPARLMRFREKVQALFEAEVDRVFCLRFDAKLSSYDAKAFTKEILVDRLGVKHLIVGDDFRFGHDRCGDFNLLSEYGEIYGFTVSDTSTYVQDGERISSTRIREALAEGNIELAAQLLGKPYLITGHVVYGKQLGRQLGLPTANIELHRFRSPLSGVFAVRAKLGDSDWLHGAANIGFRPTIKGGDKVILEVHLLDFNQMIYGQILKVEFCHKLREEQRFDSLEDLREQILADIEQARSYFSVNP